MEKKEQIETATAAVQLADAILGAMLTALFVAGSVWLYKRAERDLSGVRDAYRAGETVGEIIREAATLPEDARRELHRDIRKLERPGEADD